MTIQELVQESYNTALSKGWWEKGDRQFPEIAALLHSEISEAFEEYRAGRGTTEIYFREDGKPEGIPVELADLLVRVGDFCGRYGIDLAHALKIKMEYNRSRPHRHGNKVA